jgi:hypothetical protein
MQRFDARHDRHVVEAVRRAQAPGLRRLNQAEFGKTLT